MCHLAPRATTIVRDGLSGLHMVWECNSTVLPFGSAFPGMAAFSSCTGVRISSLDGLFDPRLPKTEHLTSPVGGPNYSHTPTIILQLAIVPARI